MYTNRRAFVCDLVNLPPILLTVRSRNTSFDAGCDRVACAMGELADFLVKNDDNFRK